MRFLQGIINVFRAKKLRQICSACGQPSRYAGKACDEIDREIAEKISIRENSELNDAGWEVFGDNKVWAWTPSLTLAHSIADGDRVPAGSIVRPAANRDLIFNEIMNNEDFKKQLIQGFEDYEAGRGYTLEDGEGTLAERIDAIKIKPAIAIVSSNEKIVRRDATTDVDTGAA